MDRVAKKQKAKDLVDIGVFGLIYFAYGFIKYFFKLLIFILIGGSILFFALTYAIGLKNEYYPADKNAAIEYNLKKQQGAKELGRFVLGLD